jgi:hypothetical protein
LPYIPMAKPRGFTATLGNGNTEVARHNAPRAP